MERRSRARNLTSKANSANVEEMLFESGLGANGKYKKFADYVLCDDNRVAFEKAKKWMPNWKEGKLGLLFYGPAGTGKTHLAESLLYSWITSREVFGLFLPTIKIPRNDSDALIRLMEPDEVPILVLDDLGAEKLTERSLECTYSIISERLRLGGPIIATTNYLPRKGENSLVEKYGDEYGDRIVGRIREACQLVPVGGEDRRFA